MSSPIATALATLLCGRPVITDDLANQKTEIPIEDTAADVIDEDEDGFGLQSDCDDADAAVNPNAVERCDGSPGVPCSRERSGRMDLHAQTAFGGCGLRAVVMPPATLRVLDGLNAASRAPPDERVAS